MDFKILFASFALVFLAELGDKTQLTALAFSTRFNSPWAVFIGTSLALIATTALAVLLGSALSRVLPPKIMQISSAVMFILIGLFLLVNIARRAPAEDQEATPEKTEAAIQPRGTVFNLVMSQAATFEERIIAYLDELSAQLEPGPDKETLDCIISEDRQHLVSLSDLRSSQTSAAEKHPDPVTPAELEELKQRTPALDNKIDLESDGGTESDTAIDRAIAAEEGIADYYLALARMSRIHAVRDAFRWLAMEDIRHAQTLCSLRHPKA
jgi:rubrerythrin